MSGSICIGSCAEPARSDYKRPSAAERRDPCSPQRDRTTFHSAVITGSHIMVRETWFVVEYTLKIG